MEPSTKTFATRFRQALSEAGNSGFQPLLDELQQRPGRLPVLLPRLPRVLGKDWLGGGRLATAGIEVDLDAWRHCDAAAWLLFESLASRAEMPSAEQWVDLVRHGDQEERTMLLRVMSAWPLGPWTAPLLREAQQTNHLGHVVAATLDSNLCARALAEPASSGFEREHCDRLFLKLAFLDLPLERVIDWQRCAGPELSRMLIGLATEREAAGRKVWFGTNRMIGHAPCPGAVGRLLGGLECGVDEHREAAAEGLAALGRAEFAVFLEERRPREDRPQVLARIEQALTALG